MTEMCDRCCRMKELNELRWTHDRYICVDYSECNDYLELLDYWVDA